MSEMIHGKRDFHAYGIANGSDVLLEHRDALVGDLHAEKRMGELIGLPLVDSNLPQIGAAWVAFHRRQLVVADTVGVFASSTNVPAAKFRRLRYGVLGKGLPHASVFSLAFSPVDPDLMVAATFGRGVWTYRF